MNRHSIAILLRGVCPILGVDAQHALQTVQWPESTILGPDLMVSSENYILLWDTIIDLAGQKANPLFLGRFMANGPIFPIFLAFSTAPHLREALSRMARYKSLFGPVTVNLQSRAGGLRLELVANESTMNIPATLAVPIGIFMVEKARSCTAREIVPTSIYLPRGAIDEVAARNYFGTAVRPSNNVILNFSNSDLREPFLSKNDELWLEIERDLERQLLSISEGIAFNNQIEMAIRRSLNSGAVRVEAICEELGLSRSTMQRKLKQEGLSYQFILDKVRHELSMRYLTKSILKPSAIAGLVGFGDSKSFHRAFKKWTKMTPEQFRNEN